MRILFLENNVARKNLLFSGFKQLGHEARFSGKLNEYEISETINKFSPDLIFSMGWGLYQTPKYQEFISKYVKNSKIPHMYWSVEDPKHTHTFTLPLIDKICPDFVFTICKAKVDYFKLLGIPSAHLEFGYNPNIHYPTSSDDDYRCSIALIARPYTHLFYECPQSYRIKSIKKLVVPLINKHIRVDVWGKGWNKYWKETESTMKCTMSKEWIHGYIPYTDTNKVYNSADIVLGFQNNHTHLTRRTFEILGSGGFLITCDTLGVRQLFKPGKDLVVSSSPKETLELVNYYMYRPDEREKICKQAKFAVKNHTYKHRAAYVLDVLKKQGIL